VSGSCARGGCGFSTKSAKDDEEAFDLNAATDEGKRVVPSNAASARVFLRVDDE
jgi:hypothetical protein